MTSLNIDLQRKEEETSDVKEKLADYKKQIQQVQKEVKLFGLLVIACYQQETRSLFKKKKQLTLTQS